MGVSSRDMILHHEVATRAVPFHDVVERLDSIPAIATRMAEQILAEIGTNIEKKFPITAHLCSWAELVPGHNESAGKRKSEKS
jgi:transposase